MAGEGTLLRTSRANADAFVSTADADKTKGDTEVIEDLVGFWLDDVDSGDDGAVCIEARKALFPKQAALAIAAFKRVYWDNANKVVNTTNTGRAIGWCREAAAASGTTVLIHFHQEVESATY